MWLVTAASSLTAWSGGLSAPSSELPAGGSPLIRFPEYLLWRPTMILITAMRFVHQVWVEARALQRETLKRYPHLRDN